MRQSIGGTWVFMLVVIFTLIFASYIALTVNYSKSFKVKNEILSIIEENQGFTENTVKLVNNFLLQNGYKTTGTCKRLTGEVVYGVGKLDPNEMSEYSYYPEAIQDGRKYYYCFSKHSSYHPYYTKRAYYRITLFFKFDLPVFREISTFDVDGQTSEIDFTYDNSALDGWTS